MPTVEQPTVKIGTIDGKGQNAKWRDDPNGNLIKIILGEGEKRNGEKYQKSVCFGKEKAQAVVNAIDEVREFAES